jgi:hypothetical protein
MRWRTRRKIGGSRDGRKAWETQTRNESPELLKSRGVVIIGGERVRVGIEGIGSWRDEIPESMHTDYLGAMLQPCIYSHFIGFESSNSIEY